MFRRLSFEALNRLTMGDRATELFTSLHGQVGGTCDNEKGLGRKEGRVGSELEIENHSFK